jgi:hypothetical protein
MERYDPNVRPDPISWLNLSNQEKASLILNFHNENEIDLGHQPYLHVFKHLALENYIAGKSIQRVNKDIEQLIDKGLDRHDILHTLFSKINLNKASSEDNSDTNLATKFFSIFGIIILFIGILISSTITAIIGGAIVVLSLLNYKPESSKDVYGYEEANSGIYDLYLSTLKEEKENIKRAYKESKVEEYIKSLDYSEYTKGCPQCSESIKVEAKVCRFCNYSFTDKEIADQKEEIKNEVAENYEIETVTSRVRRVEDQNQDQIFIRDDKVPTCRKCGSKHITPNKKGYGFVKGLTGTLLVGPVGLMGGFIGSRKIQMACLNCGHRWNLRRKELF